MVENSPNFFELWIMVLLNLILHLGLIMQENLSKILRIFSVFGWLFIWSFNLDQIEPNMEQNFRSNLEFQVLLRKYLCKSVRAQTIVQVFYIVGEKMASGNYELTFRNQDKTLIFFIMNGSCQRQRRCSHDSLRVTMNGGPKRIKK